MLYLFYLMYDIWSIMYIMQYMIYNIWYYIYSRYKLLCMIYHVSNITCIYHLCINQDQLFIYLHLYTSILPCIKYSIYVYQASQPSQPPVQPSSAGVDLFLGLPTWSLWGPKWGSWGSWKLRSNPLGFWETGRMKVINCRFLPSGNFTEKSMKIHGI